MTLCRPRNGGVVANASTSSDAITLSIVLNTFLSCNQTEGTIRIFEAATGIKSDRSVETIIIGKDQCFFCTKLVKREMILASS
mmetsp:Transcript_26381/g.44047  ORF Transcript_26381/g.44047 Transcript_26381/m.44047 type:complete len:83 (-) Transcript_26381:301-549(-)